MLARWGGGWRRYHFRVAYLELFDELEKAGVRYLVVGGVAVNLHGVPRSTADLDLLPSLDRENLLELGRVLEGLGYRPRLPVDPRDFADGEIRKRWHEEKNMLVFSWYHPKRTWEAIDVLFTAPVTFEEAKPRESRLDAGGVVVHVASIEDLVAMKSGTGREKDAADIALLRRRQEIAP
jgi:hypothetical protein